LTLQGVIVPVKRRARAGVPKARGPRPRCRTPWGSRSS